MIVHYNGQPARATGWYVDTHGHRVFLRRGDLVPLCPHSGVMTVLWRLLGSPLDGRDD